MVPESADPGRSALPPVDVPGMRSHGTLANPSCCCHPTRHRRRRGNSATSFVSPTRAGRPSAGAPPRNGIADADPACEPTVTRSFRCVRETPGLGRVRPPPQWTRREEVLYRLSSHRTGSARTSAPPRGAGPRPAGHARRTVARFLGDRVCPALLLVLRWRWRSVAPGRPRRPFCGGETRRRTVVGGREDAGRQPTGDRGRWVVMGSGRRGAGLSRTRLPGAARRPIAGRERAHRRDSRTVRFPRHRPMPLWFDGRSPRPTSSARGRVTFAARSPTPARRRRHCGGRAPTGAVPGAGIGDRGSFRPPHWRRIRPTGWPKIALRNPPIAKCGLLGSRVSTTTTVVARCRKQCCSRRRRGSVHAGARGGSARRYGGGLARASIRPTPRAAADVGTARRRHPAGGVAAR